jgi:hypothetical protein
MKPATLGLRLVVWFLISASIAVAACTPSDDSDASAPMVLCDPVLGVVDASGAAQVCSPGFTCQRLDGGTTYYCVLQRD